MFVAGYAHQTHIKVCFLTKNVSVLVGRKKYIEDTNLGARNVNYLITQT